MSAAPPTAPSEIDSAAPCNVEYDLWHARGPLPPSNPTHEEILKMASGEIFYGEYETGVAHGPLAEELASGMVRVKGVPGHSPYLPFELGWELERKIVVPGTEHLWDIACPRAYEAVGVVTRVVVVSEDVMEERRAGCLGGGGMCGSGYVWGRWGEMLIN